MLRVLLVLLVLVLLLLVARSGSALELEPLWTIEGAFAMPESAALDLEGGFVYVSNVNHYAKDGNGFVSRVALDGGKVELRWLTGLNSPTGMTVHEGMLYVVDFDALVTVDLASAAVLERYPAPDSNPALNDVAVSPDGGVYVSGSASRTIYRLADGALRVWLKDDALLERANGLFVAGGHLVHAGRVWSVFDRRAGGLAREAAVPNEPLGDVDGITTDGCGGYLVTLLDDARIWRVRGSGEAGPVSEVAYDGIDLDHRAGMLAVPRVGGSLTLFRVSPGGCAGDRGEGP